MGRVNGRLIGWGVLVGTLAALNYSTRAVSGKPDPNTLYEYATAVGGLFQYALMFGLIFAIAGGSFAFLGWSRPHSWPRALGLALLVGVGASIVIELIDSFLHGSSEQGLTPKHWEHAHLGAYLANLVVVALVDPVVEESIFRGAGYSLLERYGRRTAIVAIGLSFALAHGLIEGLPELFVLGAALAWLRAKTGSTYPGMLVHGAFNAVTLIAVIFS